MKKMIIEEINRQLKCSGIGEYELIETNCSKPNKMSYKGLVVKLPSCDTCPTVNLDQLEETVILSPEKTLEQVVKDVMEVFVPALKNPCNLDLEWFMDYENVKEHLFFGICNVVGNEEFLSKVPYFLMEDLALYVRVLVEMDNIEDGMGSIVVHKNHLDVWQITTERLFDDAKNSTGKVLPMDIVDANSLMDAFLEQMWDLELEKPESPVSMWLCTNSRKVGGASVIAYPGFYDMVKKCTGLDEFFVIPSSCHEVIVYPKSSRTLEDEVEETAFVEGMIKEGNSYVPQDEVLSFFAYKYDATGNFSIAATNRAFLFKNAM